jgi:hypothetical protein
LKKCVQLFTFDTQTFNLSAQFWAWESTFSKQLCVVLGVGKFYFKKVVALLCVVVCGDRISTLECVDNVPFRGGSPRFHKTKLKERRKMFG